jgi:C-methyltransferase
MPTTESASSMLSVYGEIFRLTYRHLVEFMAVQSAAELLIPDALGGGAANADDLALRVGADRDALERLMRVLVSAGVCAESANGTYSLTPVGAALRRDTAHSMRGWVMFTGSQMYLRAWERLAYSVRSGRSGFEAEHGMAFFDYLVAHEDSQSIFDAAMTAISGPEAQAVVRAHDFSVFRALVDIGGGHGTLLTEILKANPGLRGALFEQPQVLAGARSNLEGERLLERCDLVAGNFFESVPSGYDAYVLKYIIHDWNDDKAGEILRNCRRAMAHGSRLLLVEIVNSPSASDLTIASDLEMLVLVGGKERSEDEFRALLQSGGFELKRIVPTACPLSIMEAVPA